MTRENMTPEEFIARQTARTIRSVLEFSDSRIRPEVGHALADELAREVKRALNDLADAMKVLVRDEVHLNGLYLQRLDEIHEVLCGSERPESQVI